MVQDYELWSIPFRLRSSFSYLRLFLVYALEAISEEAKCSLGCNQVGILFKFGGGRALVHSPGWLAPPLFWNEPGAESVGVGTVSEESE